MILQDCLLFPTPMVDHLKPYNIGNKYPPILQCFKFLGVVVWKEEKKQKEKAVGVVYVLPDTLFWISRFVKKYTWIKQILFWLLKIQKVRCIPFLFPFFAFLLAWAFCSRDRSRGYLTWNNMFVTTCGSNIIIHNHSLLKKSMNWNNYLDIYVLTHSFSLLLLRIKIIQNFILLWNIKSHLNG